MTLLHFGILVTICALASVGATPKEILCGKGEQPCNSEECYNPVTENCHQIGKGAIKCGKDKKICVSIEGAGKGECYNPSTHDCVGDPEPFVWKAIVCLKGEKMCYADCYNPTTQVCRDFVICMTEELVCHDTCYNPKEQQCSQGKLCRVTEKPCNGHCYPNSTQGSCFAINYNNPYGGTTRPRMLW